MRAPLAGTGLLLAIGIALLLVGPTGVVRSPGTAPTSLTPVAAPDPLLGRSVAALPSGAPLGPLPREVAPAASGPSCEALAGRFASLYNGPEPPPAILPSMSGACLLGRDEAGLGLSSTAPSSASRFTVALQLPATGGAARSLAGLGVQLPLSGVPCSVGGVSYLTLDLVPPFGGTAGSPDANWSLWAPVWDLVSGGSCDPRCQNASALFTLGGTDRQFCEDDVLATGPGSGNGTIGAFRPGDLLNLTLLGPPSGPAGLRIYVNDSTRPSESLAWTLNGSTTELPGTELRPMDSVAAANASGWAEGPPLSVVASLCPSSSGPSPCNSYDGPATNSTLLPSLSSAEGWNATSRSYDQPYPLAVPFSSTGACSGSRGAYPCADFASYGGTSAYPSWALGASSGSAYLTLGDPGAGRVNGFDGAAQYAATGALAPTIALTGITDDSAVSSASAINVTVRASAFAPIGSVRLVGYGCFASGTASVASTSMSEAPGPTNGSEDGNYTGSLTYAFADHGPAYYSVIVRTASGTFGTTFRGSVNHAGGGPACSFPAPTAPWFGPANVSAIGGGYRLDFAENDSAVTNFTLEARPVLGGLPIFVNLSDTGPVSVGLGNGGVAYALNVTAFDAAGRLSAPAGPVDPGATLAPLAAALAVSNATNYWTSATLGTFNLTVTGGVSPYHFVLDFGDGSDAVGFLAGSAANRSHAFTNFSGVVVATLQVVDSAGEISDAPPVGLTILGGALGLPQSEAAGALAASLTWAPSGGAGPITGFTVFYTENASEAPFVAEAWPSNDSADGLYNWNTTGLSWYATNLAANTTVYAIVVGWVGPDVGLTPDGWFDVPGVSNAPLLASSISVTPAGGPAPLAIALSTSVTSAENATIDESIYSFAGPTGFQSVNATVAGNGTTWWLNGTETLTVAGTYRIALHAADPFGDVAIPVVGFVVGNATAPSVSVGVTSGEAIVGQPVEFQATGSGGTGDGYRYGWAFGDGGHGAGPGPNHTYESPGNYSVVVTATDLGDAVNGTTVLPLSVYAPPSVSIRATATDALGRSYNFTARADGGFGDLTFQWSFGDGSTGTGASVVHQFGGPGDYAVNVTVRDAAHASATDRISVVVPSSSAAAAPGTLTVLELGAFLFLAVVAALGVLGTAFYYARARDAVRPEEEADPDVYEDGPRGPTGPPALPEGAEETPAVEAPPERVRAFPPPDPPDPS